MDEVNVKTEKCRCGAEVATGYHPCPYAQEIGGCEDQEYCNCCHECESQCAMDI